MPESPPVGYRGRTFTINHEPYTCGEMRFLGGVWHTWMYDRAGQSIGFVSIRLLPVLDGISSTKENKRGPRTEFVRGQNGKRHQ